MRLHMGLGGFYTKKYIIIGVVLIISLAALMTGIFLTTRNVPVNPSFLDSSAASNIADDSAISKLILGNHVYLAFSFDKSAATGAEKAADKSEKDPAPEYTADSMPEVTGLCRLSENDDGLRIGWDDIDGVDGYHIYCRDDNRPETGFTYYSAVERAGLNIKNLKTGSKYTFRVAPYIVKNGACVTGKATEVTFGTSPTGVEDFHMTDETKDTVSMSWKPNERADGYILQRCFGGVWSEYQTFDADTVEFTDTDLEAGRAYYYRICPYREDSTGRMPGKTSDVYVVAGLLGPENDGSASKLGRVSLDYEKSKYADGYEIWYSKDKEDWEKLADTEKTHYSTSRLEDGETYYFRIYPYCNIGSNKITGTYTELDFVAKKEIYDKEVGDTYVEVSLDDQHMWYIVDGDVYLESDCVTGNYGSADTPKGYFSVNSKLSPCTLTGEDYTSYVTYWMPFIGGGWGLHDASWRSSFGGSIYKGGGSHGCVNLPTEIAKKMYAHIEVGTPVIVY